MRGWEEARDWEIVEAISGLGDDSYDVVFRDLWINNASKLDFLRYRRENFEMEARFYHEDSENVERDEVMNVLRDVSDYLNEEGFTPRVSITTPESTRPDYSPEIEGNYFFDSETDQDKVSTDIEEILPRNNFDYLDKIEWKH